MKNIFRLSLFVLTMLITTRCSTEEVVEPAPLEEDMRTSASLYQDQFMTFQIRTNFDQDIFFYLAGNGGKVSINWGDGTIEKKTITPGQYIPFEHTYDRQKNYTINISGDIKTIDTFDMAYEALEINNIHFGGLTNIRVINVNLLQNGPLVVNLSRNKMLESIVLAGVQRMEDVILSTTNKINHIDIAGENNLTTAVVDRVIARIHDSVVNSPRTGLFNLPKVWYWSDGDYTLVGPPSSYSINKLKKLQNVYGWRIVPGFEEVEE